MISLVLTVEVTLYLSNSQRSPIKTDVETSYIDHQVMGSLFTVVERVYIFLYVQRQRKMDLEQSPA